MAEQTDINLQIRFIGGNQSLSAFVSESLAVVESVVFQSETEELIRLCEEVKAPVSKGK
jgi:hypothetical protein